MLRYCKCMLLVIMLLSCVQTAQGQEKYTISGTITDAETGESLPGVNVFEKGTTTGTTTNHDGFYSLALPEGSHRITYSFIGYKTIEKELSLTENISSNIKLSRIALELDAMEVISEREKPDHNVKSTEMSIEKIEIRQVEILPVIMGEKDVMKTIQLTPGVTTITEGRTGFIVRGGGLDQNLILMDGIPLYYASHMQGLYSVFNSEAVDRLKVYKGGIPAHFGGRGASVLYVKTRDAKEYHAKLSAGLITSKFSLEAPVIKDRLSLFLAGRSTKLSIGRWHDRIRESNGETDGSGGKGGRSVRGKGSSGDDFYFFDPNESWMDLNGKIFYKISDRNRLYLSGYVGRDSALVAGGLTEWGNRAASLRWNHRFNAKLISNTSLIYSRYYTQQTGGIYKFRSGIKTSSFRQEFSYFPNEGNRVTFGFVSEYQDFNHGGLEDITENFGKFMPPMQSLESALFLENDQKISSRLSVYYGLRYSLFHRLGPGDGFT